MNDAATRFMRATSGEYITLAMGSLWEGALICA